MKTLFLLLLTSFSLPCVVHAQASEESRKKAKDNLESIRQRIINGESFGLLAGEFSEDPGSAKSGGIYRNVKKGLMVAEFENAAFALKPGDISEIFETQYGFHFVQLMERRGDEIDLRHILIVPK